MSSSRYKFKIGIYNFDKRFHSFLKEKFNFKDKELYILDKFTNILFYSIIAYFSIFFDLKVILITIILWFFCVFIQKVVKRERPYKYFNIKFRTSTPEDGSFPSYHTLASVFLFLYTRQASFSLLFLLVPILRIIDFQHWLSDVMFSTFFALLFFTFFALFKGFL